MRVESNKDSTRTESDPFLGSLRQEVAREAAQSTGLGLRASNKSFQDGISMRASACHHTSAG